MQEGESGAELKDITLMLLEPAINIPPFDKQSANTVSNACRYVKGLAFGQLDNDPFSLSALDSVKGFE